MKYYKNNNNDVFAFSDDTDASKDITRLSLTLMTEQEVTAILTPKIDEKAKALAQLEADIKECEDDIKHALIIGNTAVLENLRNEYKSLLIEHEKLQEQE